jgi:hypothetical protein
MHLEPFIIDFLMASLRRMFLIESLPFWTVCGEVLI